MPSLVVAFTADQPFWAAASLSWAAARARSCGKPFIVDRLGAALEQALPQRAAQIGQRIRSEDGIVRAVQLIEKLTVEPR
jgi:UDP:flavonoid glycosyltransferase YjiC (YdhE family)